MICTAQFKAGNVYEIDTDAMGHTYCDDDECHISVSGYTFFWVVGFFTIALFFLAIYSAWIFSKSCMFWIFIFFLFVTGGLFTWFLVDYYA